jgi:hypothetical protein
MSYWTATVGAANIGLLQVVITLGGGTSIQSQHDGSGNVELTYVMRHARPYTHPQRVASVVRATRSQAVAT